MSLVLLFLCYVMACYSFSLIKYVFNLMASAAAAAASSSSPPPPPPSLSSSSSPPPPPPSLSSSSSHDPQMKYDVFISFRGLDIRRGFLSHLKKALHQKLINAFVDDKLERGDEISPALLQAIKASPISLIIFSKDYADSKWCLEELVKIMECKELNKQIVIPVFYYVDPSDVGRQEGIYEDAFAQHQQKLKDKMEVQNWRSALKKAAKVAGYHYSSNSGKDESEFIDEIVKVVLEKLDHIYPYESKGLIGILENLVPIESLLGIESTKVQIIGIWGMGGVGKTTLAYAVCEKFSSQFESCCFLKTVREESKKSNGLSCLLEKLFKVLLKEENFNMNDMVKESSCKRRVCQKKVLIVIDDVDTSEQLECLAGDRNCFGLGSKIIVTSRDKNVLIGRVDELYEVKELNLQNSLKLFNLNAFNQNQSKMGYEELSKRVVDYTGGIPFALKVLGSSLNSKETEIWESLLKKLQKFPNEQIQKVLKVSCDGLDESEKNIFLDIVFFYKGECKDDVISLLEACDFYGACGIDSLVGKALITISIDGTIEMRDLIRIMGEQIVRDECTKDPGKRSRLKDTQEIYDILKNNKGTNTVEGIILDISQSRDITLSADTFYNMTDLRFLKFYSSLRNGSCNVKLSSGLKSFSDKLRYFHWDKFPLESLPLDFCAEKLVEFHMKDSKIKNLWKGVQNLVNLKTINLSGSSYLLELPNFSKAPKLEQVYLSRCISLCNVDPSILSLHSLVILDVSHCNKLKSLQSEIHLNSLKKLNVDGCCGLEEFSLSSEKIEALDLRHAPIKTLHSTIGRSLNLKQLYLNGSSLNSLPINGLCRLRSLESLCLSKCRLFLDEAKLRILLDALPSLKYLYLEECGNFFELPDNISGLSSLKFYL